MVMSSATSVTLMYLFFVCLPNTSRGSAPLIPAFSHAHTPPVTTPGWPTIL